MFKTRIKHGLIAEVIDEHYSANERRVTFNFKLGRRPVEQSKAHVFVPLPIKNRTALKKYLRQTGRKQSEQIGFAIVLTHPNHITWVSFYPFGHAFRVLQPHRQYIGSRVHHGIVEYLAKHYPERKVMHTSISHERSKQLKAMEISPFLDRYKIEEYLEKVRAYMVKKFGVKFED